MSRVIYRGRDCIWKCFDPRFAIEFRAKYGIGTVLDKRSLSEEGQGNPYCEWVEELWDEGKIFWVDPFDYDRRRALVDFVNAGKASNVAQQIRLSPPSAIHRFLSAKPTRGWSPELEIYLQCIADWNRLHEIAAYRRLRDLQGFAIPRFVANVIKAPWHPVSRLGDQIYFQHRGILLEYVDGFTLDRAFPGDLSESDSVKLRSYAQEAVKVCNLLPWHSLHLKNLVPSNILIRHEQPAEKPSVLFIDLKNWIKPQRFVYGLDGQRWIENEFQAHAREDQEGQLLEAISRSFLLRGGQLSLSSLATGRFRHFGDSVSWPLGQIRDRLKAQANRSKALLWEISMDMVWVANPRELLEKLYLGASGLHRIAHTRPRVSYQDLWSKMDQQIRKTHQVASLLGGDVEKQGLSSPS